MRSCQNVLVFVRIYQNVLDLVTSHSRCKDFREVTNMALVRGRQNMLTLVKSPKWIDFININSNKSSKYILV